MEAGRIGRAMRAAMFAVVSVTLAATGHVLMSEAPLPFRVLAAGFFAIAVPGWWVAARERGTWLVIGLTVTTQAVLHNAFATAQTRFTPAATVSAHTRPPVDTFCSTGEDMGTCTAAGGGGRMAGTDHTAHGGSMPSMENMGDMSHAASSTGSMDHMGSMGHMGHDMAGMSSTGMLAAHLLAALLCGLWLARGERAAFQILWSVAGWLLAPLQIPLTAPAPSPRPMTRACRGLSDRLPRGLLCARDLDPRGPPGGLAAL
ncbi:hypothetical protein ABZ826_26710 [Streptomyces sp. NPDC047515]|uniref:hypothetical protein n=1 Tax=Streptomyces sp. NPDC047515 TaxID=3155380 RepID=UPI003404385C